jgi:DNA polymerase
VSEVAARERRLWLLDQKINNQGFLVDLDLADAAIRACVKEKKEFDKTVSKITKGTITSATQRERLLKYLQEQGVEIANLQKVTLTKALDDKELQGEVRSLLEAREQVSKASTGKYHKLLRQVGPDGRMRNALQFAGAKRTARWAGRAFQPHNMPRPKRKPNEIETVIRALKADAAHLLDNVHDICADTLRSLVIAQDGKILVVGDYNAIEGRIASWLAGENWKLRVYRDPNADMYIATLNQTMGRPIDTEAEGDQRQWGKVFELAFGYEGGVGALVSAAKTYRVPLEALARGAWTAAPQVVRDRAIENFVFAKSKNNTHGLSRKVWIGLECAKLMWRRASPAFVAMWKAYNDAAIKAVTHEGKKFSANKCTFMKRGNFLYCRLPSGRYLVYANPRVKVDGRSRKPALSYQGDYAREAIYGGKWTENITQAVARDRLAYSMLLVDEKGFTIVLHVHDEIAAEEDQGSANNFARLKKLMEKNPPWALDLPIRVAGYEATRYKKD